ncbi:MAG: hypothetical protein ACI9R3_005240 [Verrucomicrobiales bacterium]|jgi:hypothetical protein
MMGTPAYMSPEQAEVDAVDIDTRSDIYTLGAVLYELLCGSTPLPGERLKNATFSELRHLIRDEDPPRPAARIGAETSVAQERIAAQREIEVPALRRQIGGELGWIAMKALEKDRQRRYATANALAADVGRFLSEDPVEACPPTALYQFRKFVRKHRLPFLMVTSVIVALGLGLAASTWQAVRAFKAEEKWRAARDEALEQLRTAQLYRARSTRKTLEAGRQFDSLDAIAEAAAIRSGLDLRNEAIAALAQPDLRTETTWNLAALRKGPIAIDDHLERFARGTDKGEVDLFRLEERTQIGSLPRENSASVKKLRFSPDGTMLAVGYRAASGARYVKLWTFRGGSSRPSLLLSVQNAEGGAIDFSADGTMVAIGGDDNSIGIFDLRIEGTARCSAKAPFWANCVRFRPDGRHFAVCGRASQEVLIFDTASGEQLAALRHPHSVQWLDWREDGSALATACSDFNAYLWNLSDTSHATIQRQFRGHEAEVVRVAFHPNRRFLFTCGWDNKTHVWNTDNGQLLVAQTGGFSAVVDNGRRLVSAPPGLWEFDEAPSCISLHIDGLLSHKRVSIAFSPDGSTLVAGTGAGLTSWHLLSAAISGFVRLPMVESVHFDDFWHRIGFPSGLGAMQMAGSCVLLS